MVLQRHRHCRRDQRNAGAEDVQAAQAGAYSVVVFNGAGSATSSNALLTVLVPAVITRQPASTNVVQGSNALFSVAATSSTLITYQWQCNGTNLPGRHLAHADTGQRPTCAGRRLRRGHDRQRGDVTSQVAMLTVILPPAILVHPEARPPCSTTVTMSVTGHRHSPAGLSLAAQRFHRHRPD